MEWKSTVSIRYIYILMVVIFFFIPDINIERNLHIFEVKKPEFQNFNISSVFQKDE